MRFRHALLFVPAAVCFLAACSDPALKLPQYDRVPAFAMTDSEGRIFTERQMDGSVWVVDFIYTNCPAECPRMSSQLHKVEGQFQGVSGVQFLSVSVDPVHDTPPVLHEFAHRWGAPNAQWRFITGTSATVHLLANTTFHVGDVIDVIQHSTKFALVDRHRVIRGYYSSFDPESMAQMAKDIGVLRRARS